MIQSTIDPTPPPPETSCLPRGRQVSLVAPFEVTRLGMRILLETVSREWEFSEWPSLSSCMQDSNPKPDVMLLDLVPNLSAREFRLLVERPPLANRTLAVLDSGFPPPRLDSLFEAGIGGVIQPHGRPEDLQEAVLSLFQGKRYFCRRIRAERFEDRLPAGSPGDEHPLECLSPREVRVFQWIGCRWSTCKIAGRLERSPKTIETYREHLKTKLGLPNAAALSRAARAWVEHGTLSP